MRRMLLLAALGLCGSAQAEDGDAHLLRSSRAEATSYLQSGWNRFTENYHPTYVLDEDPTTAWIEGVEGNGEGSVLTLPLSTLSSATSLRLRIRNGYQKSAGLLRANAAPNEVDVRVYDADGGLTGNVRTSLAKEMGWQLVDIPIQGGVASVQIEVISTHSGTRYHDTCISDVLVEVSSEVPYNEQAELAQLAQARAWISERVRAAEYFASQPPDYPFAGPTVSRESSSEVPRNQIGQRMAPHRAARARFDESTWFRPEATQRVERLPDGAWELEPLLQYTRQGNITWAEVQGSQQPDRVQEEGGYVYERLSRSQDRVLWRDEARTQPEFVRFKTSSLHEGRGTYFNEADWVLSFDENGRLASAFAASWNEEGQPPVTDGSESYSETLYVFEYSDQGQISGWTTYWVRAGGNAASTDTTGRIAHYVANAG